MADEDAEVAASALEQRVRSEEPQITSNVERAAERWGGQMLGLDRRFKSHDSLVRKMKTKDSAEIKDALRYTIEFSDIEYSKDVQDALFALQEDGYSIVTEDNTWMPGDPYSGLAYNLRTPSGVIFELQFHTSESYDVKENKIHKMYEEYRDLSVPLARRQELYDKMSAYWDLVPIPAGAEEFPVEHRYLRPVAMAIPHKRIEGNPWGAEYPYLRDYIDDGRIQTSVWDNRDPASIFDPEDSRWQVSCDKHGSLLSVTNLSLALGDMRHPEEWCEGCQEELGA